MQESWENMANHIKFEEAKDSIGASLEHLEKWYPRGIWDYDLLHRVGWLVQLAGWLKKNLT
jgi:hypothetical protein